MNIRNRQNNISKIRESKGLNTATLISRLEKRQKVTLSYNEIIELESQTSYIDDKLVEALGKVLGCTKDELFPKIEVKVGKRNKSNIYIVVDTCVLMRDNNFIKDNIDKYELFILDTVMDELSKNKNDGKNVNFKDAINALNKIGEYDLKTHKSSRGKDNDERIYNTAEELAKKHIDKDVILFTYDSDYVKYKNPNNQCKVISGDVEFKKYFNEKIDLLTDEEKEIYNLIKNNDKRLFDKDISECNLDVCYIDKMTPISYCIKNNYTQIINHILYNRDVDLNKPDLTDNGYPPIFYVIMNNDNDLLIKLINKGMNVNTLAFGIKKYGYTPLMCAAWHGYSNITRTLIDNNASIHQQDLEGHTALHKAAMKNRKSCYQLLEKYSDDTIYDREGKLASDYIKL